MDHWKCMFCLKGEISRNVNHQFGQVCWERKNYFLLTERNNFPFLPKITGKMKVASYGLVLTRVIEQMEAVKPYTVKAGTERGWRNAVRGQGPTKQRDLPSRLRTIRILLHFCRAEGGGGGAPKWKLIDLKVKIRNNNNPGKLHASY